MNNAMQSKAISLTPKVLKSKASLSARTTEFYFRSGVPIQIFTVANYNKSYRLH